MTLPGLGGLVPRRPDQPYNPGLATVAPGATNVVRARLVIVSGSGFFGIFLYSPAPGTGNLVGSWTTAAGTDTYGNAYPAGLSVTQGAISGVAVNATQETLNPGPLLLYGNTATVVQYLTGSGNFLAPTGVTAPDGTANAVMCEGWGPGGPGSSAAQSTAGGGGEYAMDPHLAVTPLANHAYVQGSGSVGGTSGTPLGTQGSDTTFAGAVTTLRAHAGQCAPGFPSGGTGSLQPVHFDGGPAGNNTGGNNGSGGGGSAGPASPGNAGKTSTAGGGGAAPVPGGGPGGAGGTNGVSGHTPTGVGGGGGGAGNGAPAGGNGAPGQLRVTYSIAGTTGLVASLAAAAGIDPGTGLSFPGPGLGLANTPAPSALAGWAVLASIAGQLKYASGAAGDTNIYNAGRATFTVPIRVPINSTSDIPITGITQIPVAAARYRVSGAIFASQGGAAFANNIGFTGPAISDCGIGFLVVEGTTIFGTGFLTTLTTFSTGVIPTLTTFEAYFSGIVTFSASGLFGMRANEGTATHLWNIEIDSYLDLEPA